MHWGWTYDSITPTHCWMQVTSSLDAPVALARKFDALSAETLARFNESTQARACISERVITLAPAPDAPDWRDPQLWI
eukprot:2944102-Pyramimonas_sp.AAC.1